MRTIEQYIEDFKNGKITQAEMEEIISKKGGSIKFWDASKERHPNYPEGNNESRVGFEYNPYHHPKGKLYQSVIKKSVLKAIDFAHYAMVKLYDKDAFVYEDERLLAYEKYLKDTITEDFTHCPGYKDEFMTKVVDIILSLMKIDVYYRGRFIKLMNNLPRDVSLTEVEQNNIDIWH